MYITYLHPFHCVLVADNINFVHGDDEREFALVKNGAGVQHVGHEGDGVGGPHRVHHIDH